MAEVFKPAKKEYDLKTIEQDYRAGIKTLRLIGAEHSCSHVTIQKMADKYGWTRDLSAKIKAKAEELVTRQAVTKEVTKDGLVTEKNIIEANAQQIALVALSQREDIKRCRRLVSLLLDELEGVTDNKELFDSLGVAMFAPNDKGVDKLNEIYQKVMALPGRVGSMKALAESLRILIELERKVYKMEDTPTDDPLDALIKRVSGTSFQVVRTIEGECREVDRGD